MSSETEEIPQFRPQDFPMLQLQPGFNSLDSSDPDVSSGPSTPYTLNTPCTPATPLTQLSSEVSSFGFADIKEGESSFAAINRRGLTGKRKETSMLKATNPIRNV